MSSTSHQHDWIYVNHSQARCALCGTVRHEEKTRTRFWIWWNGAPVRITLHGSDLFEVHTSARTEEGWASQSETFWLRDDYVQRESATDGVDCDGRLESFTRYRCHVSQLAAGDPFDSDEFPAWERLRRSQRDYSAEAAGY
jgi:hypothetical protein